MADRPIIFSAPMIRALLDGRKTQTRRIIKEWRYGDPRLQYLPGDRLYVREAHALVPASAYRLSEGVEQVVNPSDRDRACIFRSGFDRSTGGLRWRPSIHMPRWASRLTLTVTDVRVQRLQEISEADAVAEGIEGNELDAWLCYAPEPKSQTHWADPRQSYRTLWNSLHGPDAWDANPWVAAISFTVKRGNIDA